MTKLQEQILKALSKRAQLKNSILGMDVKEASEVVEKVCLEWIEKAWYAGYVVTNEKSPNIAFQDWLKDNNL